MRVVIAGSRDWSPTFEAIEEAIKPWRTGLTEVVSGGARGADLTGETWARTQNVAVKRFPADWRNLGAKAGLVRNQAMARYADVAIVFWQDQSSGSANLIANMAALGKPVQVGTR